MARRSRRKSPVAKIEVIDETHFDYAKIWDGLVETAQKSEWDLTNDVMSDDSELILFYDIVVERYKFRVMSENGQSVDQDQKEQINEMYQSVCEKSGLTDLELEQMTFNIERLSRMDTYNEKIIELIEGVQADDGSIETPGLLQGAQRDNDRLPVQISELVRGFGSVISQDIERFNNEFKNLTVELDEKSNEFIVVRKKAKEKMDENARNLEEAQGLLSKGVELLGDIGSAAKNAAAGTGGFLKKTLFGDKKKTAESRFDAHYEKIKVLQKSFIGLQDQLKPMEHDLTFMYEKGFKPVQAQAVILGREYDTCIIRYDEYIGALTEIQNKFEGPEGYLAIAKENAENGKTYEDAQEHLIQIYDQVQERINNLLAKKEAAMMRVHIAADMLEDVKKQMNTVSQSIESIPSYNMDLNTLIMQMDQLKNKKVIADSMDFDKQITELIVNMFKANDGLDQELDSAMEDKYAHVARALEEVTDIKHAKAERALETARNRKETRRELEASIDNANAKEEEARKMRSLEGAVGNATGTKKDGAAGGGSRKKTADGLLAERFADKSGAKSANDDKPQDNSNEDLTSEQQEQERKDALENLKKRSSGKGGPKNN